MEVKKENTMKKVKKMFSIILILFIICFIFYTIRNFIIYSSIYSKVSLYYNTNNVYYEKYSSAEPEKLIKYSKLNDFEKIETVKNNSIYLINWNDFSNNEFLDIFIKDNVVVNRDKKPETHNLPLFVVKEDNSLTNKFMKSMSTLITTEKFEESDCYVITQSMQKTWIEKETGLILKIEQKTKINDEEKIVTIIYSNWKFDELTNEDIKKPNTDNYLIKK